MIVSLRGTNGSGKSTVVRDIMARAVTRRPIYGVLGARYPESYELDLGLPAPLVVLGPYTTASACGLDGVTNYDAQLGLVRKYASKGNYILDSLAIFD